MSRVFAIAGVKTRCFAVWCTPMHDRTGAKGEGVCLFCAPAVVVTQAETHNQRSTLQCDFDDHDHSATDPGICLGVSSPDA